MAIISTLLTVLLWICSGFLIILVLIQRGKGGGLTGALGGMGGQSAFGTKAGDVFTRITVIVASLWILICIALFYLNARSQGPLEGGGTPVKSTSR